MEIKIKGIIGDSRALSVHPSDSLETLQVVFQSLLGIPIAHQKIIYYGKVLTDTKKKLYEYKIANKDTLTVVRSHNQSGLMKEIKQQKNILKNTQEEKKVLPLDASVRRDTQEVPFSTSVQIDSKISPKKKQVPPNPKKPPPISTVPKPQSSLSAEDEYAKKMRELINAGFPEDKVQHALEISEYNPEKALANLRAERKSPKKAEPVPQPPVPPVVHREEPLSVGLGINLGNLFVALGERDAQGENIIDRMLNGLVRSDLINTNIGDPNVNVNPRVQHPKGRATVASLTAEDKAKIKKIMQLGFEKREAIKAYLDNGKDATAAANALLQKNERI